jgi:2-C-methyl-D-erythritol 4-phosphate cytidylyltransferase
MPHYTPASLILVGAGKGLRMGGRIPKPFLPLAGKPILFHTLQRFHHIRYIKEIILVLRVADIPWVMRRFSRGLMGLGVTRIVPGGQRRQDSVYQGLIHSSASIGLVVVHDAVRPFIREPLIREVIRQAVNYGAAIVATPAKDTIKRVSPGRRVVSTLPRNTLWHAQTPQAACRALLLRAYAKANRKGITATDESQLLEAIGIKARIVEDTGINLKITTPKDLALAEFLIRSRRV